MFVGVLFLPESPRWLFLKGFKARGVAVLEGMHLDEAEIAEQVKEIEDNLKVKHRWSTGDAQDQSQLPPRHWPWDWTSR